MNLLNYKIPFLAGASLRGLARCEGEVAQVPGDLRVQGAGVGLKHDLDTVSTVSMMLGQREVCFKVWLLIVKYCLLRICWNTFILQLTC